MSKSSNEPTRTSAGNIEQQIFALINAERSKNGLSELEWSESLAAVARMHSEDMANVKFFSHRGSDGSMVDDRADRLGLGSWRSIGENIAYMRGFDDPAALAVEKWLESAAHRKNLLGPNWKESAVGVAMTDDGTYYMTEVFLLRK
ncbi:MAG: CAP domain-containing protein [Acidobacteriota bacterium]